MAKAGDSNKIIADLTKENRALRDQLKKSQKSASADLKDQVDYAKAILNTQEEINKATAESAKLQNDIRDATKELNEWKEVYGKNIKNISKTERDQYNQHRKTAQLAIDQAKQVAKEAKLKIKELEATKKEYKLLHGMTEAQRKAYGYKKTSQDIQKEIEKIQKEIEKSSDSEEDIVKSIQKEKLKQLENLKEINDIEIENLELAEKLNVTTERLAELQDKASEAVGKSLGFLDKINDKIKEIPIVGGILSEALGIDELKEKLTKDLTKQLMNMTGVFKTSFTAAGGGIAGLRAGITSIIPAIGEMGAMLWAALAPILPILLPIVAAIIAMQKALEMDQAVSDTAKAMGQTKHEAFAANEHFIDIAANTDVIGANSAAIAAANKDLNAILGTNVTASKEMLEAQVLLTKQYGLTGEEAAAFQSTSAALGKTTYQNLATIESMVKGYNTLTGDSINFKEISSDIAKTSKTTLASYKGDVKALTLAAIQAKKMGMSMDDAAKAADSLLDIETSIESEMKANVLTGKHMNLNAARALSLEGKKVEAAAAAAKEAGTYDELMAMKPYQLKAVADAAGLLPDQLLKAAELQKYSLALGDDQIKSMSDLTEEQLNQLAAQGEISKEKAEQLVKENQIASAQERLSALGDKLMTIFLKIAEPIAEILDPFVQLIDFIFPLISAAAKLAFAPIIGVADMIGGIIKIFHGDFKEGLKQIGAGVIEYFYAPFKFVWDLLTGFFPSIKTIANDAINWIMDKVAGLLPDWAIKLIGLDKSKEATPETVQTPNDAVIDPNGGLIVQGKEGKYQLNKDDSIVAGTDLLSSDAGLSGATMPSLGLGELFGSMLGINQDTGNKEVIALLKELIAKVEQPVKINIGGRVIDELESQASMRRSYNTKIDGAYGANG